MKKRILNNSEMAFFCGQMAMIVEAGISPLEGATIMLEDAENKEGREILEEISENFEKGDSFYKSLAETGVFPEYALNMIELGEKAGKLEEVLKSLYSHYSREENLAQTIKNAVTYPFIIAVMMIAVVLVLIIKVLPVFNKVFIRLGSSLTGPAKVMLNVGNTLNNYSLIIVIVIAVILILYLVASKTDKGQAVLMKILSFVAGRGKISEAIGSSRFASGMALTISAGLDTEEGLNLVQKLIESNKMREKIAACRENLNSGQSFSNSVYKAGIFSGVYSGMILVGNRTGSLENVMENIADRYEHEVNEKMNKLVSLLEPTIVIIMSIIVCLILVSVMLPLMAIMTSIM